MRGKQNPIVRNDLLNWRIAKLGTNPTAIARQSDNKLAPMTIARATQGKNISVLKLRTLAEQLGLNPKYLLDFNLSERQFHRAVVATENGVTNR